MTKRSLLMLMLLFVCGVLTATVASAQDKGRAGLAMGFPGSVAIVWHPTEAIGIRPEISISRSSTEFTSTIGTITTTTRTTAVTLSTGVSAMFYSAAKDNLRVYFSPRAIYTRLNNTIPAIGTSPATTTTLSGYAAGGSVGAQYALGHRFSAYGEVGFSYAHQSQNSTLSGSTSKANSVSTRSAAGVILYF
jgi:hypothetical protein